MKRIILITAAFSIFFYTADAQLLNKIKQKAKEVASEAIGPKNSESSRSNNSSAAGSNSVGNLVKPKEKTDIIFSNIRGGTAKTEFGLNDNIYGRIMLDQPLYKTLYDQDKDQEPFVLMPINLIYLTGNVAHGEYVRLKIPKSDYNKNYIDFDILPAEGDVSSEYSLADNKATLVGPLAYFGDASAGGPPFGRQEFWVNFGPNNEYKGNFYFTVNNIRESHAVEKRLGQLRDNVSVAAAKVQQLPPVFSQPSGKNADPQLSLANLKKMMEDPSFKILKMTIEPGGTADYNIQKNALDVPEYKITARPLWVVYKDEKGQCYFSRFYFTRDYEGGGKYGPLKIAATTAQHTLIACENVK